MSHFRTLALRRTLRASTLDRLQLWLCEVMLSDQDHDRETTIAIREADLAIPPTGGQRFTLLLSSECCVVVCGTYRSSGLGRQLETLADRAGQWVNGRDGERDGDQVDKQANEQGFEHEFTPEYYDLQLAFEPRAIQAFLLEVNQESFGYTLPESLRSQAITQLHEYTNQHPYFERAVLDLIAAWETESESRESLDRLRSHTELITTEIQAEYHTQNHTQNRADYHPTEHSDPTERVRLTSEVTQSDLTANVDRDTESEIKSDSSLDLNPDLNPDRTLNSNNNGYGLPSETATTPIGAEVEAQLEAINPKEIPEEAPTDIVLVDIWRDTITRALEFLQLDRLAIYQFTYSSAPRPWANNTIPERSPQSGSIVYEALASSEIGSLKHPAIVVQNLLPAGMQLELETGFIVIDDIHTDRRLSATELQALQAVQVESQVIVPLHLHDQLWGVLLAQQCTQVRSWSSYDCEFLRYVAADMSLAIQQAHTVAELQHQKYTIEQIAEQQAYQLNDAWRTTQVAQQARTEFLSMMSHELRTPLACIIGMSSTLLRWSFGHLNDKQREYLKTIYDSGEHLLGLIDDLLDLTQLESGATQLKIAEFSLSQLARHIIRTALDRATVNGIQLDLKLDIPAHLDLFRADRARVNQILFNLLGNAIKFTLTGGRVLLSVMRNDQQVIFAIQDTGIGIPKSQQASLFESFRQVDGTYTREYGGTGLGLALTKQLVELHHGTIEVQSEPDVGSCFTVYLPQANEPTVVKRPTPSLRPATHIPQGHIVLVTRRENDATLICDVLTAAGLQVIWMLDGSTALEQIQVLRPIVAIVDRYLDGIDGFELTSILRQSHDMATLRIVMIGNGDQLEDETLCLSSGADRCVTTPLNLEQLLTQVIDLIELESEVTAQPKASRSPQRP